MQTTTVELLRILEDVCPARSFEVKNASGQNHGDGIRLDSTRWLWIDAQYPPMVTLTDETPETGGQIAFWLVKDSSVLSELVQFALQNSRSRHES